MRTSTEGTGVTLSGEVIIVVTLPQGLVDPKGGSFANPKGELPRDSEEELLEDPERFTFWTYLVQDSGVIFGEALE